MANDASIERGEDFASITPKKEMRLPAARL